jgi:hypothetical protein
MDALLARHRLSPVGEPELVMAENVAVYRYDRQAEPPYPQASPDKDAPVWRRIELSPGVELHLVEDQFTLCAPFVEEVKALFRRNE